MEISYWHAVWVCQCVCVRWHTLEWLSKQMETQLHFVLHINKNGRHGFLSKRTVKGRGGFGSFQMKNPGAMSSPGPLNDVSRDTWICVSSAWLSSYIKGEVTGFLWCGNYQQVLCKPVDKKVISQQTFFYNRQSSAQRVPLWPLGRGLLQNDVQRLSN